MTMSKTKGLYTLLAPSALILLIAFPVPLFAFEPKEDTVSDFQQEAADYNNSKDTGDSAPKAVPKTTTGGPGPATSVTGDDPSPAVGGGTGDSGDGFGTDRGGDRDSGGGDGSNSGDGSGDLSEAEQERLRNAAEKAAQDAVDTTLGKMFEGLNTMTGEMLGNAAASIGADLTKMDSINDTIRQSSGQKALSGDQGTHGNTSFDKILKDTAADPPQNNQNDLGISGNGENTSATGDGASLGSDSVPPSDTVKLDWNPGKYSDYSQGMAKDMVPGGSTDSDDLPPSTDDLLGDEDLLPSDDPPQLMNHYDLSMWVECTRSCKQYTKPPPARSRWVLGIAIQGAEAPAYGERSVTHRVP